MSGTFVIDDRLPEGVLVSQNGKMRDRLIWYDKTSKNKNNEKKPKFRHKDV